MTQLACTFSKGVRILHFICFLALRFILFVGEANFWRTFKFRKVGRWGYFFVFLQKNLVFFGWIEILWSFKWRLADNLIIWF